MQHMKHVSLLRLQLLPSMVFYRKRLDASEPLATLFIRILGSFQTEAEAKTRVLNLYHCVLSAKVGMHEVLRPLLWNPVHL